jgi:hypothetical protein
MGRGGVFLKISEEVMNRGYGVTEFRLRNWMHQGLWASLGLWVALGDGLSRVS